MTALGPWQLLATTSVWGLGGQATASGRAPGRPSLDSACRIRLERPARRPGWTDVCWRLHFYQLAPGRGGDRVTHSRGAGRSRLAASVAGARVSPRRVDIRGGGSRFRHGTSKRRHALRVRFELPWTNIRWGSAPRLFLRCLASSRPSRPQRCPRPAEWQGGGLDAKTAALVGSRQECRASASMWFASGPLARRCDWPRASSRPRWPDDANALQIEGHCVCPNHRAGDVDWHLQTKAREACAFEGATTKS